VSMNAIQRFYEFFENIVFPELRPYDRSTRDRLLREARDTPFDWIEWAGILAALGIVAMVTRYNVGGVGFIDRVFLAALNFLVAAVLLAVLISPLMIRRTKRGLRSKLR
jgi:hypothetical protein